MENDTINHIDTILDESSNLTYNSTLQELCPDYTKDQLKMLDDVAFWLDGVAKSMTALLGIFSNILAAYVLNRPKMKNSFNLCLVALACIDTIYLFLQFLESLRKRFHLTASPLIILNPQFLYPVSHICMTAGIYMIVAITFERYCAVHYPLDYRQAANDPTLMKRRLWRYVGPVTLVSILLNTSKFFEAYVDKDENDEYNIKISDLRRNHIYSAITNWMRLVFLSFLPLVIIIFFNFKVYKDIKERSNRSFELKGSPETKIQTIEMKPLTGDKSGEEDHENPQIAKKAKKADPEPSRPSNEVRRRAEDKLAIIFLVIILGFILCHLPRVGIDVHEILTLSHSNMCSAANLPSFPAWTFIGVYVSHFSLVLNATMNNVIYCFMSEHFRTELFNILTQMKGSQSAIVV